MTPGRLQHEEAMMTAGFSPDRFTFFTDCMVCVVTTGSNKQYTIQIDLTGNYPEWEPKVFIVSPKPLLTHDGQTMLDANPDMHTLAGEKGCVRACAYGRANWRSNLSLYHIIKKMEIWLATYEEHLKTGHPMGYYLDNDGLQDRTE